MKFRLLNITITAVILFLFFRFSVYGIKIPIVQAANNPQMTSVYNGNLNATWHNWSWNSTVNLQSNNPSYNGNAVVSFLPNTWGGFYLHNDSSIDVSQYPDLHFVMQATQPNEKFALIFYDQNNQSTTSIPLTNYGGDPTVGGWKQYSIPLTTIHIQNNQIKGFALQNISGTPQSATYIGDIRFMNNSTMTTNTTPTSFITTLPSGTPVQNVVGYTTTNNILYKNGQKITLHGISWFGFETGNHTLQGLWTVNWKDSLMQMKSLGFNAVRIPFCPATLQNVGVNGVDVTKNPDLAGLGSLNIFDKVITELNNQHMYILLDHHTPDCNAISNLWYTSSYSEQQWLNDLQMVAQRYKNLEYFMGIDIKNEPHGNATWGTGNTGTDWNTAAEKAGKAILSVNPNLLIMVQGIQDNPSCSNNSLGHWQGGNLEPVNCKPIDSNAIPANKLILSPHVYGPDVWMQSYFTDNNFPNNMPAIWDTQFGNLTNKGMTIVPGEWGGRDGTNNGNPKDAVLQNTLVNYFTSRHICNSFYWDWNPNSGDTGGILQDDWKTPWSQKMQLLNNYYANCK